ncbi:MAG: polysaccharide deacetylase, partial [Gammaproteobacteria bacterium]|nr:polysaccharide deacetylase [Gammaproteobacteria bacterium]
MSDRDHSSTGAWVRLYDELDLWSDTANRASFWWRDDDAIEETAELKRLNSLSQDLQIPVALATIPSLLQGSLPGYLHDRDNITVF